MALTWTLKLNDAFSGPIKGASAGARAFKGEAKGAAVSADSLAAALKRMGDEKARQARLDAATAGAIGKASKMMAGSSKLKNMGGGLSISGPSAMATVQARLRSTFDATKQSAEGFGGSLGAVGGALGGVAMGAATATLAVAALGAKMALSGILYVRDAQAFRSSTLFAFEKLTGSKDAAQKAMDLAGRTAVGLGADYRESASSMNSLMAQGFSTEHADRLIKRMADLKTINPMARSEGIVRAITQIKTTGRLQGDELMQLAEAGLSVSDAYDEMAKALGIVGTKGETANQKLQKMQAAGKITADVAIAGIEAAIAKKTGGGAAGAVAGERASASLEGAIAKTKALAEMQLAAIKIDWSPAVRAVERFQKVLASPAGARFMSAIGDSITKIVALADSFTAEDMATGFDVATNKIVGAADATVAAVKAVTDLKAGFDGVGGAGAAISLIGGMISFMLAPLAYATDAANGLAAAFRGIVAAAREAAGAGSSVTGPSGGAGVIGQGLSKAAQGISGLGGGAMGLIVGVGGAAMQLAGRAGGGPVNAGQGYMVGERGPEYFQPTQSGSIVPNGELARVSRAGENIGRAVTNSNSSTSNRTFVANVNATAGAEDMGAAIADQLRHLVAGYA